MPDREGPPRDTGIAIVASALVPGTPGYFRCADSPATPSSSEGVSWTVFKEPAGLSPAQIHQFAALFPMNARPIRGMNHCFLLENS